MLVAAAVAMAGCLGGSSDESESTRNGDVGEAQPEADDENAHTDVTDGSEDEYPPGIDESGLADPEALLLAHVTGFDMRSYEYHLTVAEAGETVLEHRHRVNAVENRTKVTRIERVDGDTTTTETYANREEAYAKLEHPEETEYETVTQQTLADRTDVPNKRASDHTPRLTYVLDGWDQITERQTEQLGCRNNPQSIPKTLDVAALEVTGVSETSNSDGIIDATNGRMLVDEEGRIRKFSAAILQEADGDTLERTVRWEYEDIGRTDVEEPDWLAEFDA